MADHDDPDDVQHADNLARLGALWTGADHEHEWVLKEYGYTRTWLAEIADGKVLARSGEFTENGDCIYYLLCPVCYEVKPLPDDIDIEWN